MTRRQATVFGEVAGLYHRHRPDYPVELFEWIAAQAALRSPATVIDVGCGTGKSSAWFVARGDRVVGIEPDAAMASLALANATGPGTLEIAPTTLEEWSSVGNADLMVSGQAWHWADPATRFVHASKALAQHGWLCVFWNRPDVSHSPLTAPISEIYHRVVPDLANGLAAVRFPGSKAAVSAATPADEIDNSGHFGPVATYETAWLRTVTAEDHCANLLTQSDHRLLDPMLLEVLLGEISNVIEGAGGRYELTYTTHAYAAKVKT